MMSGDWGGEPAPERSDEIAIQLEAQRRAFQIRGTIFGAEYDVDQDIRKGLRHCRLACANLTPLGLG
jgi:hypothetical protein